MTTKVIREVVQGIERAGFTVRLTNRRAKGGAHVIEVCDFAQTRTLKLAIHSSPSRENVGAVVQMVRRRFRETPRSALNA